MMQNNSVESLSNLTAYNTTLEVEFFAIYVLMRRLTGLVLYPLVCFIGIPANIIGILILSTKQMRSPTSMMLIALAVTDSIKIVNDFLYFVSVLKMEVSNIKGNVIYAELYPVSHYLFNATATSGAWMTVAIGAERYTAACRPHCAKTIWTTKKAIVVSILIVIASFSVSVPYMMKYQISVDIVENVTEYNLIVSDFWNKGRFAPYYVWLHHSLRSILPILIVITFSILILKSLKKCHLRHGKQRISVCVLVVIACFVLCVFPDSILSTVLKMGYHEASYLTRAIRELTDFLLLLHTTLNFIIYCAVNKQFSSTFKALLKKRFFLKKSDVLALTPPRRKLTLEPFLGGHDDL